MTPIQKTIFVGLTKKDYTDFIREHFAHSDCDEKFIGFTERDLVEGNNNETMDISKESDSDGEEESFLQSMIMLG